MSNGLPDAKPIRIRSFYGLNPEDAGYVGWSKETNRDAYLHKLNEAKRRLAELNAGIPLFSVHLA